MMQVISLDKKTCEEWVTCKHYSRRAPIFWFGFGLVEDTYLQGVIIYGQPSAPIQKHAFKDRDFRLIELSRLVIQTKTRNAASFLIAGSLRLLPKPCAVVSYADSEYGHCGYVYQATNWLYTGATVSHDHIYLVDGKRTHPMTLRDRGITDPKRWAKENNIKTLAPMPKHRYFYFCGNKPEKKTMRAKLVYPQVMPYPKCVPNRYDEGPDIIKSISTQEA